MKLAWICYDYDNEIPMILFEEPPILRYHRIIPIVYAEIQNP